MGWSREGGVVGCCYEEFGGCAGVCKEGGKFVRREVGEELGVFGIGDESFVVFSLILKSCRDIRF
jgi:hypothetical protein